MFGCHNCGQKPLAGTPYQQTACAGCRAMHDPALLSGFQAAREDSADYFSDLSDCGKFEIPDSGYEPEDVLAALSRTIRILLRLKDRNPETYRVVEAKMDEPGLSYAQLAEKFSCRKQNIHYHLKKAVRLCPELGCALITDVRRLGRVNPPFQERKRLRAAGFRTSCAENPDSHPSD